MKTRWLLIGLLLGLATAAWSQEAAPTVTLDVKDKPIREVADEIGKQIGMQVGLLEPGETKVTLTLEKAPVEEAIAALAKAFEGSWARFYLLEKQLPETPYVPEVLMQGLQNHYESWFDSLTDEKRKETIGKVMAARGSGQPVAPGAGTFAGAKPEGDTAAKDEPLAKGIMYDPVRMITIPGRVETVTLELADIPLPQALFQLTSACSFLVAPSYDLVGNVTLKADKLPLRQALDEVAQQVGGQWRTIYLIDKPHPLSDADEDKLFERFFQGRWSKFWSQPREERAKNVEDAVRMIGQWKTAAAVPAAPGRPTWRPRRYTGSARASCRSCRSTPRP
ncbi:MAG: hypothetical protein WCP21_08730 [Armatimonadota bacterium]